MKRVGIISFHRNFNFGAALQCGALCETLKGLGADPVVIDYAPYEFPPSLFTHWGFRSLGFKKALKKKFFDALYGGRASRRFAAFRKANWDSTTECETNGEIEAVTEGIETFVTGSDQVFRLNRPSPYFLEWGSQRELKRISYAACCTSPEQPPFPESEVRRWISRFNHLSVRDSFSKEVLKTVGATNVSIVADPTLLVDYPEKAGAGPPPADDYILVYLLGEDIPGGMKALLDKAKKVHPKAKVLAICSTHLRGPTFPWADRVLHGLGPMEWVQAVRHARLVVTDSFHGMIFATKFKRPLVAYYREKIRAPRLLDLVDRYRLEGRLFSHSDQVTTEALANGPSEETLKLIGEDRERSMAFLKEALSN